MSHCMKTTTTNIIIKEISELSEAKEEHTKESLTKIEEPKEGLTRKVIKEEKFINNF